MTKNLEPLSNENGETKISALTNKIKQNNFNLDVLSTQVSSILRKAILENILKEGEKLVEADLQRQFGISRSPLREALRELDKEGLVVIIPRKGTFVRRIERKDIESNFPVRATLEALAAEMAYPNITEDDLDEMEFVLLKMKKALRLNDHKIYWKHHTGFHDIFIYASRNEVLIDILKKLRMHSLWYKVSYQNTQENHQKSFADHQEIFQLFKHKKTDIEELKALVKNHIIVAFEKYLELFDQSH